MRVASSKTKTACVHFCTKRNLHNDPCLHLDGNQIKVVKDVKFLGVIFYNKLSLVPHIKILKENVQGYRCHNSLPTPNGVQIKLLFSLFIAPLSKLDYGCIVYGSARTYLKALDAIHLDKIFINVLNQLALEFKSISMTLIYL